MINSFEKNIILLVKSALDGCKIELDKDFDLVRAHKLAQEMQIAPLLYYGLERAEGAFEREGATKFVKSSMMYAFHCQNQEAEIERVLRELDKEKIEYLKLKGTLLKPLYPSPDMRLMSDADILIKTEQYPKIKRIMKELSFKETTESDHEYIWEKDGVCCIELHKRIIPSYNKDYYSYFGDGWSLARPKQDKPNEYEMSSEDTFIYLFTHFSKHYRDTGIGVKHVTDFYVYLKSYPELDWEYIRAELEKLQLLRFWDNVKNMLDSWFGDREYDEVSELITRVIFAGGAYGCQQAKVLSEGVILSKSTQSVKKRKLLRLIFPPYKHMKQRYIILKRAPILLPFMWAWRLISTLFTPRKISKKKRELNELSQRNIEEYQRRLNYVGLDFNFK